MECVALEQRAAILGFFPGEAGADVAAFLSPDERQKTLALLSPVQRAAIIKKWLQHAVIFTIFHLFRAKMLKNTACYL